ncbi:hypothetical protein EUX98_g3733 [Antrodiella citrinella]|uniref:BAG domain-containing protein n=1 Tax=Antrodiella citrinella TaxID=2447956 RepID=A0A4V6S1V8_9APHY|nr:hypothetical protein EUX98_g3733 [Antrodiella citrinella]
MFRYGIPVYDQGYARAVAEEQAAHAQYAAALRAQEEARNRAARARAARQAYTSPYASFLPTDHADEDEGEEEYPAYGSPDAYGSAYGLSPYQRQALAQLEREKERQRLAELRQRKALEQDELRRRLVLEEQRKRQEAEELRRKELEEELRRRDAFEQFYRNLGLRTPQQTQNTAPRRARTTSPPAQRPAPSPAPTTTASSESKPVRIPIRDPEPSSAAERAAAAEKIQTVFRTHAQRTKALQAIDAIDTRFQSLKAGFAFPTHLDFHVGEEAMVTVDTTKLDVPAIDEEDMSPTPSDSEDEGSLAPTTPKLAYSSNNASLHQYDEELNQLLVKLDAVESGGEKAVRERRREMVRRVEREARRVEGWKGVVWRVYQEVKAKEAGAQVEESVDEVMDETPANAATTVEEVSSAPEQAAMDVEAPFLLQPTSSTESSSASTLSATTADEPTFDASDITSSPILIPHASSVGDEDFVDDAEEAETEEVVSSLYPAAAQSTSGSCAMEVLGETEGQVLDDHEFVLC